MVAKKCRAFKVERDRDGNKMTILSAVVPFKFISVSFVDGDMDDIRGAIRR